MDERRALLELTREELAETLAAWGEPRFRVDQVWRWLYASLVSTVEEMRNLPAALRARLGQEFVVSGASPVRRQRSEDGLTEKVLLRLRDGEAVETVLMREGERRTVCLSSQVGCAVRCAFCATGLGGWTRDLIQGEIVEQALHYARELRGAGQALTNVVYMGMGEPLLNYDAVLRSLAVLGDAQGLNLGARRFTVSTAGVVPGIERLAGEGLPIGLAVSLHAATDELRTRLVPLNSRYPLARLIPACRTYAERTHRRVTFEYALIDGLNDAPVQADALAGLLAGLLCHVNLIPVNPLPELPYRPSPQERVLAFERRLKGQGVNATLRVSRGADIQAGCGQLRGAPRECETIVNA